ncbi:CATRA system-associated protein [Actinokineospora pegani]|uniref:CATRA system-associated protein n=1 Tax=Actinokineospora pegani TaxID=2654637 RepID=UPI001F22A8DA|nr:CATRA system-associated protein [Actinokineospora pegani]
MPGTVVTFYSYKGGVGRSFAMANTAVLLARWGFRVLCVDWDLEAPGLHLYFRDLVDREPTGGVVDLVADFERDPDRPPVDHVVSLPDHRTLDLLAAGRTDDDYAASLQAVDWAGLYDRGFGDYLERCRQRWVERYDFVLVDSRTGISDIGGICTAQLPDRLVLLFTANLQSVQGVVDVARRAEVARDLLPYDRSRLTALPVLSRFDSREEYGVSQDWRARCLAETRDLYRGWLDRTVSVDVVSRQFTVPYVAHWSFGEKLPVITERTPTPGQVSYAIETLAALIAHDFDRTNMLGENRDAFVAAVREHGKRFTHEVVVAAAHDDRAVAGLLVEGLRGLGVNAARSLSGDVSTLARAEVEGRHLCVLIDRKVNRWQESQAELFMTRTIGQERRVFLVLTQDTNPETLPGFLANLRHVRLGPARGPAEVAAVLADRLRGHVPLVEDEAAVDLAGLLAQLAEARLRPALWDLVDDVLADLHGALAAGDDAMSRRAAADLAVLLRPRLSRVDEYRVAAPPELAEAVGGAAALLRTRTKERDT